MLLLALLLIYVLFLISSQLGRIEDYSKYNFRQLCTITEELKKINNKNTKHGV